MFAAGCRSPATFKSASRAQDRSLNTAATPESSSIYAESGRSATVVDVRGNAISSKSKSKSSSKKFTRKTTAGLRYHVNPPLVKRGMGDWLQQKVLTAGKTADATFHQGTIHIVSQACRCLPGRLLAGRLRLGLAANGIPMYINDSGRPTTSSVDAA